MLQVLLGGLTLLVYLTEGALGLPVFAGTPEKGIGMPYMLGTTGGYLVGFVLAALVVGFLAEAGWDRNLLLTAAAMLIGNIVIYVPGLLWLGHVAGWDNPILHSGASRRSSCSTSSSCCGRRCSCPPPGVS